MKVIVVTWSHPDGSAGTLGVFSTVEKARAAAIRDRGCCVKYSHPDFKDPEHTISGDFCEEHRLPIKEAYGNYSAWIDYRLEEYEIDE